MSREMIRARLTPTATANGNGSAPPAFPHIPSELRDDISKILETEGMMDLSAENRIIARIDKNHAEIQRSFKEVDASLHLQDKRVLVIEEGCKEMRGDIVEMGHDVESLKGLAPNVALLTKASETATEDRRKMAWLVKGSIVTAIMGILIGAVMSVYGTRQPVVREVNEAKQEAKQDNAALITVLEKLSGQLERQEKAVAAPVSAPGRKGQAKPHPEPPAGPSGPGASLREGEIVTTDRPPRSGD